jgi:hypothetical protein
VRTFHEPAEVEPKRDAHVVTFVGSEEADILHAGLAAG